MKSLKKRLNEEFDKAAPSLKKEVLSAPIENNGSLDSVVVEGDALLKRKKGVFIGCVAAFAVAIIVALIFISVALGKKTAPDKFVFALEINPSVSFVTDDSGSVLFVNSLNDDADIVLSDDNLVEGLKNLPLKEAIVKYAEHAAKLGYIDVNAQASAVRLSFVADSNESIKDEAVSGLKDFFKSKGIYAVVAENKTDESGLSEILGIDAKENVSDISEWLKQTSVKYCERNLANVSAEELEELYRKNVFGDKTMELIRDELLKSVSKIMKNVSLIKDISVCSLNIYNHSANPSPSVLFNLDYWTIKEYGLTYEDASFIALMEEMDGLLLEYKNSFGKEIASVNDLTVALTDYSAVSSVVDAVGLQNLFSSLNLDSFRNSAETYLKILADAGNDVSGFRSFLIVPSDVNVYIEQLKNLINEECEDRLNKYRSDYENLNRVISDEEYEEFVNGVLQKYGSTENFWQEQ